MILSNITKKNSKQRVFTFTCKCRNFKEAAALRCAIYQEAREAGYSNKEFKSKITLDKQKDKE